MNYCMRCGTPNGLLVDTCKKCGNSMKLGGAAKATPIKTPTPAASGRPPMKKEQSDPPKRSRNSKQVIPSMVSAQVEETDEDDEGEGVSLDFVPEVSNLEFEPITPIEVKGVSFASLVSEAEAEKRAKGLK